MVTVGPSDHHNTAVSFATLVVVLDSPPSPIGTGGDLQASARIPGDDPVNVNVRAAAGRPTHERLAAATPGTRLLVSGELGLAPDGNTPIVWAHVLCDATEAQYVNETMLIGRLTGAIRDSGTGKSASRTLVSNSFQVTGPNGEGNEISTYYQIRGFGRRRERLLQAPKGAAICVLGSLSALTNKAGERYCEVRVRVMRILSRTSKPSSPEPASTSVGYDTEAFTADAMPAYWGDGA